MDKHKEKFPYNQKPNEKLSDYVIDDIIAEDEAISDMYFNTEDNQKISTEDIRICTDPNSPFFMMPEGEGMDIPTGLNIGGGIDSNLSDALSSDVNKPNIGDLPIGFRHTLPKEEVEILSLTDDKIASENLKNKHLNDENRHIKTSKTTTNKYVILLVTLGALLMMWYTTFAQPIASNSKQVKLKPNHGGGGSWEISFTDMYQQKKIGSAQELTAPKHNSTKASFHVLLANPGDEITYNLTIKNNGTLNAKVSSIHIMPQNKENDLILFYVDGINVGDYLDAGKSTNMTVTAKYNAGGPQATGIVKPVEVIVQYVQR